MKERAVRRRSISRREACVRLGGVIAGGVIAYGGLGAMPARAVSPVNEEAQGKTSFHFRYILASCLYGRTKLEKILPQVRKTGAEEIDIWPEHHANQREQVEALGHEKFTALLREHRVRLGMITRYDLGPFGLGDEMRVLKQLGGDLIITGSRGAQGLTGEELKAAVREFVEKMKPHLELAGELGVTVGIENHSHALIHSPDSLRYLAELSPSAHLGIALAPYHLPQDPRLLASLIRDLGPCLVHFYAWQYGKGCMKKLPKEQELEQLPGRGSLDFEPLVAALREIDYKGRTEIFMHPVPRGIPILETTEKVTREVCRARDHLERCLEAASRRDTTIQDEKESRASHHEKPEMDS